MKSPLQAPGHGVAARSKGKSPPNPLSRRSTISALAGLTIVGLLSKFENAANLKFFAGVALPWKIWKAVFVSWHGGEIRMTHEVRGCDEIGLIFRAQHPILFKSCVDRSLTLDDFLLFFRDQVQNMFPPCEAKLLRHFAFEPFEGGSEPIVEDVPWVNSTLEEKMSKLDSHELSEDGSSSYFEVHTQKKKIK